MKYVKRLVKALGVKLALTAIRKKYLKLNGFDLLTIRETIDFMEPYQIKKISGYLTLLPKKANCLDPRNTLFPVKQIVVDDLYVWEYKNLKKPIGLSVNGSVVLEKKVLCTDHNHDSFYNAGLKKDLRPVLRVPGLIAPFSHVREDVGFIGYYDFVIFVLVKISRIKDSLPDEIFSNLTISYPPFSGNYETEYLELLGLDTNKFIDSTQTKVISPHVITASGGSWHPNIEDIRSLKRNIFKKIKPTESLKKRIYISRVGTRRILNEEELISLLKKYNFTIIEDTPRSLSEQISIYYNASFIIGPHGASFTNIIWCQPGTHLFELFSSNYLPDYFLHLTKELNMEYSAYCEESFKKDITYFEKLTEDIQISIPKLESCLKDLFED
ncbi:glycosyltransferase family 61 protein [Pedobacter paludis]|uniref:Glycosyltransferase family 61 protein n=1 Tax=Pedobacter paludis TaxID=2203212 RepID=A0A317ET46_9SPHI|nr:glycosyltransferase family 61 protein [Pedobacter paludis]PWS29854.1 glycosyltransferase family 61 protein [Pedobacter paludis]